MVGGGAPAHPPVPARPQLHELLAAHYFAMPYAQLLPDQVNFVHAVQHQMEMQMAAPQVAPQGTQAGVGVVDLNEFLLSQFVDRLRNHVQV